MNVDNISKERFLEAKKKITKKYPGAKTVRDHLGKYYVATADGRDINNLQVGQVINSYNFDCAKLVKLVNTVFNRVTLSLKFSTALTCC